MNILTLDERIHKQSEENRNVIEICLFIHLAMHFLTLFVEEEEDKENFS